MRVILRITLLVAMLLCAGLYAPTIPTLAQSVGSFKSSRVVVGPLQPVLVHVNVVDYTGPATLLVFDGAGRSVGAFDLQIGGGFGAVEVQPRGAPGEHWAALFASGRQVAAGVLYRLEATTVIQTGVPAFDQLYERVRNFMAADRLAYELNGRVVAGYRSPDSPLLWLRDHYYQNRAFRYFESDLTSLIDAFREAQAPDGGLPDFLARPEWAIPAYRTEVEADVEYLFVQLVAETWKVTGDIELVRRNMSAMQKAIEYTLTSPLRWEPSLGLVKRPFTIDTWDFEYGPTTTDPRTGQPAPRHWIDDQTRWGIFHGDNTGLVEALRSLAGMEEALGLWEQAYERRALADQIMARLNNLSWNGRFYTHHVKLVPYDVPGVDEAQQLSMSNAIALNRGVLTVEQGRAIIAEYLRRLQMPGRVAFAEWWSIDPPFPAGAFGLAGRSGERPGEYVNGGIMPLVGGELARGAFHFGYEAYGFDIIDRYYNLIDRSSATYLWYYPTGGVAQVNEYLPTDGWGSSAMFGALIEGAAGLVDEGLRYETVQISPRWSASPRAVVNSAYVSARYAASGSYVAYRWDYQPAAGRNQPARLNLEATGSGSRMRVRMLLPGIAAEILSVSLNGQPVPTRLETVGTSRYIVIDAVGPIVQVQILLR